MKQVETEIAGRKYMVSVPDDEEDYTRGLIIGPPDLSTLDLPEEVEIRLNNELFVRGLISRKDVFKRRNEVFAAWQSALSVNVDQILRMY